MLIDVVIGGLLVGGLYGLIALGLNLQYGVARMMNLSYGEFFMGAAFAAFFTFTLIGWSPLWGAVVAIPAAFVLNWLLYRLLLLPLMKRAPNRDAQDGDVILSTFGLLFVLQGLALVLWGGEYRAYSYLAEPVTVLGSVVAINRLVAFFVACALGVGLYIFLKRSRVGTALRAVAIDPVAARLVGVDVQQLSAFAFAAGGALMAAAGILVSMFVSFNATIGVIYTLKALIVVIMGGVGSMIGSLVAGLLLGLAEALGAHFVDPGLTLAINFAIFLAILIWRPQGLFSRA